MNGEALAEIRKYMDQEHTFADFTVVWIILYSVLLNTITILFEKIYSSLRMMIIKDLKHILFQIFFVIESSRLLRLVQHIFIFNMITGLQNVGLP